MKRPLPYSAPKCIFCGGTPTNREHVWSRWSHRFVTKGRRKWHAIRAIEHRDRSDYAVTKHAGDPHDWQVKCVDELCNNGWMRELENAARPILTPLIRGDQSRKYLGKKEQLIIAAWVALKVMIQEHSPRGDRIAHHTQRKRLWKKRLPPSRTWRIWIANVGNLQGATLWTSHPMLIVPDEVARRRKSYAATYFNSQAATYVIGKLFIHVVRSPHERLVRDFRFAAPAAAKLGRVWPLTGYDVIWPLEPLTANEAGYVASAVRNLVARSGRRVS